MMQTSQSEAWDLTFLLFWEREGLARYAVKAGRIHSVEWICKVAGHWYIREHALSPTGDWLCIAFHSDTVLIDLRHRRWHWLTRNRTLPDSLYRLVWSPDGRFLVGVAMGEFYRYSHLTLFSLPPSEPRVLTRVQKRDEAVIQAFGWFPDSRRVWLAVGELHSEESTWSWYKVALSSSGQVAVSSNERRQIQSGWDFLPRAHRYAPGSRAFDTYAYTADRQLRIQFDRLWLPHDMERPLVQFRGRPARPIKIPDWLARREDSLIITDVSLDKKHLLACTQDAYYIIAIDTSQWTPVVARQAAPELFDSERVLRADFVQSSRLLR